MNDTRKQTYRTANAVRLVAELVELQGAATALDLLVGRLCLEHPMQVELAAQAELVRLGAPESGWSAE